jgi:hypothetical protein
MININEFRNFVLFVMDKSGNGEVPTPEEFNRVTSNSLTEWTANKIGNPGLYQPGRPIPPQAMDVTQRVIEDLRHLKETREFIISSNAWAQLGYFGRVILPDGSNLSDANGFMPAYLFFGRLDAIYVASATSPVAQTKPVQIKSTNQVSGKVDSLIAPPTKKRPIGEFMSTYIQVYPKNVQKVILTYLREPVEPVWGYGVVNGRPVYDSVTSVNIDAPYLNKNEIAMIYLKYQGIHLNDVQLAKFASEMQQVGV